MPPTTRRPVAPGSRRVRLALSPCGEEPGVLEIHQPGPRGKGTVTSEYLLWVLPPGPAGRAYRLRQYAGPRAGTEYHTLVGYDPTDSTCDCPDSLYRGGGCKHVLALEKLRGEGKI